MKILNFLLAVSFLCLCVISCKTQNRTFDGNENSILLKLINKRLQVAPLVAKSKWNTKKAIDDPVREKIILDSIEVQSKKMGINRVFAHSFFQAQFEAGKIKQRQLHDKWKTENQGLFNPVPDLATEVRPILDSLNPLLLLQLKKINCNIQSLKRWRKEARKIVDISYDNQIVETAIKPVENYCKMK
ncbi:chorismate mutase [Chryseobacterium sp. RU37D]|uniref:gamma subclass chorismate mutase AroQ n=1 Tax=Chryseobacterium sp. RU37D TaxID=1907397 RepID=UPI0009560D22|nr:gamma subclass chorismate mutase AroQ [Chryseobacterium sp. RU37D]SIP96801.1 chorismate mutase [Chryseobacterium sp. RU37D]